jgi:hypothetical protein
MAVMLSKTYDALISAGAAIETDLAVIKWMLGVNLAASLSIVIKLFV